MGKLNDNLDHAVNAIVDEVIATVSRQSVLAMVVDRPGMAEKFKDFLWDEFERMPTHAVRAIAHRLDTQRNFGSREGASQ